MIATNGDRIKKASQIQKLFDKGLNQLQINVYSDMKRFRFLTGLLLKTTAIPENVYNNTSPKKQFFSIEQKYDKRVTPASTKIGRFELTNRSGNVPSIAKPRMSLDRICVRPFRLIQINWKGEVILCCNDYYADVVCGNINEASVTDIWYNSKVLNRYRKSLLNNNRKGLKLCDICSFTGGSYTHFIRKQWRL
jgi:MoaA/NifB/PqqE/SkfB family radical SAM enzyme